MDIQENKQISLLVVDDDAVLRDLIRLVFSHQTGYEVSVAGDGMQALEMIQEHRPDVLILDILLPRMNGLELLRHLNQQDLMFGMTVVMISALGYQEIIQQAVEAGAADFLVKPFDIDLLIERLNKAIQRTQGVRIPKLSTNQA